MASPESTRTIIPRRIRSDVLELLAESRAVAILGPRQAGKSTLLLDLTRGDHPAQVVTLDDRTSREAAQEDPTGFVAGLQVPAAIDEVQRAPDVLLSIKQRLDRDDSRGQFLLTGSANILALPAVKDALPGRIDYLTLWPLAAAEIEEAGGNFVDSLLLNRPPQLDEMPIGRAAHAERLARGGYPEAQGRSRRRLRSFFQSYLASIVERDLGEVARIRVPDAIERLLRVIAARTGSLLSFHGMGADLGLDKNTVHSYVRILEDLFLVQSLKPWHMNLGTRQVKSPKLYVVDSGLLLFLLNANAQRVEEDGGVAGAAIESFVVMELLRLAGLSEFEPSLFHYRDKGGREVDVVIESSSGAIAGVEVKAAASVGSDDFAGLRRLRDKVGARFKCGAVLYAGERTVPFGERLVAVPIAGLWSDQRRR